MPADTPVADTTVGDLLGGVASAAVTPSGGAVAAVGGGAGAALCEMVCIHTLGRDDLDAPSLAETRPDLEAARERLLALADEDVAAVEAVGTVLADPEAGADDRRRAAKRATEAPLETAEVSLGVLEDATVVTDEGARNALADAGTGARLAAGALRASLYTVRTNLDTVEDEPFVAATADRADELEAAGRRALRQIEASLDGAL